MSAAAAMARLVEYAQGRFAALATHTTLEILEDPQPVPVPGAASHAHGLLSWQGRRVPMIDLHALLHGSEPGSAAPFALVIAYQAAPGRPVEYGALALRALPRTVEVADAQQCALPNDSGTWPLIAMSCFHFEGESVPILDTGRLFGSHGNPGFPPS